MKNFDWLQAFAMEQQEQPEPGVSADAAPQDEQERAEAFRALIQGPYKKDYDRQVQMIVRERLKNCARSEQVLKSLGPALEKTFGVDAAQLTPEQAERLAACAPEGKVPVTKEQREEAMRFGSSLRRCARRIRARSCMRSWKAPCSCALSCAAWMPEALTS